MKDGSYYEGEFTHGEIEGNGLRYWAKTGKKNSATQMNYPWVFDYVNTIQ